jgi:hypothetical protein
MWLPTQAQVNAATRNIASGAAGAILMFGLSTKINPDTVTSVINATGTLVSNVITFLGVVGPIVAAYYASRSASPASQVAAVSANPSVAAITVTDPALATAAKQADPSTDVKVKTNA